jgi:hypothetical protein
MSDPNEAQNFGVKRIKIGSLMRSVLLRKELYFLHDDTQILFWISLVQINYYTES